MATADWVAWIMLGLFLGILLVAGVFLLLAKRHLRKRRGQHSVNGTGTPAQSLAPSMNLPNCWLAIRSVNTAAIQQALELGNTQRCTWAEGVAASEGGRLFITPPVQGWTLVMGAPLPSPEEDADLCFHFLVHLSHELGHVQFFSHNAALSHHAWVRAHNGHIERAYAWAGETLWHQGTVTSAETLLRLRHHPYGQSLEDLPYGDLPGLAHNTEMVPLLAAHWGVDPAAHALRGQQEPGTLGEWLAARSA